VLIAALASFLPTAILNIVYCHDWSGLNLERAGMNMKNPFVGIWGNALLFLLYNFLPPFFPLASWWNQNALTVLPHAIVAPFVANFEESAHWIGELPTEDWIGIGFGVSVLCAASLLGSLRHRSKREGEKEFVPANARVIPRLIRRCALVAPWIALLAYCMKSGMATGARLISPYYPIILPLILIIPASNKVVQARWWRILAWMNFALALLVVAVTPGRPLWPAQTVLSKLHAAYPRTGVITRALNVYRTYGTRFDPLANVRELLPPNIRTVGFMASEDDLDISFWRPFGSRRVEHVFLGDSEQSIRQRHIEYIVVGGFNLKLKETTLESWLERVHAEVIAKTSAIVKVAEGEQPWYVVRLPAQTK